jgi:CRP-like cAMP-binding protein
MAETKLITVWDYMDLKFNEEFIRSVAIFDGLTLNETKFTTLMAYTHNLKKDEILFKENDSGDEMYIVLKGSLELYLDKDFHSKKQVLIKALKGKSFGEMALFRNENRVATAKALEQSQVLVLNNKVLNDLQKRYPKIASKFFFNLSKDLLSKISDKRDYEKIIKEKSKFDSPKFGYKTICSLADTLQQQNITRFKNGYLNH